ncbi:hypothetical protein [Rubritalea tangerina]|uniref:FecR protein domain-containing protein n=1 Tax=Rubritalea tangerina TaxID=430798 RepID=A0ABW4ZBJ0_9BACT
MKYCIPTLLVLGLSAAANPTIKKLNSRNFSKNTQLGQVDFFLESEKQQAQWTIQPHVTVTGGRFFIGSIQGKNKDCAHFVLDGGGTLAIDHTRPFAMRLGQNEASEVAYLTIKNGTKLVVKGNKNALFRGMKGSFITLQGPGSSIQWHGSWGPAYKLIKAHESRDRYLPLRHSGGKLEIVERDGITTATVVPEPNALAQTSSHTPTPPKVTPKPTTNAALISFGNVSVCLTH